MASLSESKVAQISVTRPHLAAPDFEDHGAFDSALAAIFSGESQVAFHYQPIVDLKRGVVSGYEALARFPSSMGPSPDVTFAAAARAGKKYDLEKVVALAAVESVRLLPPDCFLSINVSPGFLLSQHWDSVVASVDSLAGLVIEITEEESISDYKPFHIKLDRIRALGGYLAVDDAGSGYASLQHIIEIKPNFIKIDRTLINECHSERARSVLIEMMGRAANRLDAWIIAEGLETPQELSELMDLGVPLGQGYYLGRPNPIMQPLAAPKAAAIRSRIGKQNSPDTLARHVQSCPVRPSREEASAVLASTTTSATVAIVTDRWDRPTQVLHRHQLHGVHILTDFMRIQVSSDPVEALHRALTRPMVCRFDPFVVIDSQGALEGIVRIDRLMCALLDTHHSKQHSSSASQTDVGTTSSVALSGSLSFLT